MEVSTANTPKVIVPGVGPKDAKIMIVGEAPGAEEERTGKPFVGPAGKLLDELLHRAGILRMSCYVTNVVKEKPFANNIKQFIDLSKKQIQHTIQFAAYVEELKKEIEEVNPNVIVAVGAVPLWALCNLTGITKWRGSILESSLVPEQKVIPIIHPAAALRQYTWRHFISFDLRRVARHSNHPEIPVDKREYFIRPSFEAIMEYLDACMESPLIAFDIEVSARTVTCISFARSDNDVMSIPFTRDGREYFTPPQAVAVWRKIGKVLANTKNHKVGQNVMFDSSFLCHEYGIVPVNMQDTMIAQAILFPDFPKGLDFITSIYTEMPYYKDEGKSVIKDQLKGIRREGGNWEERFWLYNAKDSVVLQAAFPEQQQQLISQGNWETYVEQTKLLQPLLFMTERGIRMDNEGMAQESSAAQERISEIEEELNRLIGYEINPRSPKQLMEYFYDKKRIRPYQKNGRPTIDEKALKRIAGKGFKEASLLLEHRTLAKMNGTYYTMQLDTDGRLRYSINPVGTRTGRLSSSKTIYGTGANIQNQPPVMKKFMLVDEGYVGYNIDLSQAENRVVAYLGPDLAQVDAFEAGVDIHSKTASLIFGIPVDEVIQMHREGVTAPLSGGQFTHRFWGKKANHGLNYGLGYRMFAVHLEIAEKEAKWLWEQYHRAYPGVRKFHHMIQEQLRKNRTVTNLFGRKYRFVDRWGETMFKEAYAFIPQSTVADIVNRRGLNYIWYECDMPELELLAQVHDSIMFQIKGTDFMQHAQYIRDICRSLEKPLKWFGRTFSIPAEVSIHPTNFKDGAEIGKITQMPLADIIAAMEGAYG